MAPGTDRDPEEVVKYSVAGEIFRVRGLNITRNTSVWRIWQSTVQARSGCWSHRAWRGEAEGCGLVLQSGISVH